MASKCLLIFGFLLAASYLILALDQQTFRETCIKEQPNLTPAEIQLINEHKVTQQQNASKNLQCFVLCMFKKFGIVTADGKQNPDAIIKYFQNKIPNKSKIMKILASCANTQQYENACATAFYFDKCIQEKI